MGKEILTMSTRSLLIIVAFAIAATIILFGNQTPPIQTASQKQAVDATQDANERIIGRLPIEQDEPLAITAITVNDRRVELNRPFVAPGGWIRNLVISVKNISNKPILFASIRLVFPRSANSSAAVSIYDVVYGDNLLMTRQPASNQQLVGLMPGNTASMKLSVENFVELERFLRETDYPSDVERIDLRIGHVIFDDDTMWYAGTALRRDPNDSGKWVNVKSSRIE